MEHEVFVPLPADTVRAALAEPERVAHCVPGLQLDPPEGAEAAASGPDKLTGRLRLRIGGSTITYRGTLTVTERGEGLEVDADAAEARGDGSVRLSLTVVPRPVPDGAGSTLSFAGRLEAGGRITELEPRQRQSAGRRLLDRFTEALVAEMGAAAAEQPGLGRDDDNAPAIPGIPAPAPEEAEPGERQQPEAAEPPAEPAPPGEPAPGTEPAASGEPPALAPEEAPEADVARRTMIGRSAEEVDHAPPRGRYAPVPASGATTSTRVALRWAAPAALAVASAVVVGRVLRRRR